MSDRSPNNDSDADTDTRRRTDEIAFHIYTKAFQLIYAARASDQGPPLGKIDKWFNLETPVAAPLSFQSSDFQAYRSVSSVRRPEPLTIQVFLAIPSSGTLVHVPTNARICSDYRLVLLEEWRLEYPTPGSWTRVRSDDQVPPEPATIYKAAISLFRSVFSLLRILPAWRTTQEISGWLADRDPTQVAERMRVVLRLHSYRASNPTRPVTVLADTLKQPDSILKFGASLTGPRTSLPHENLPVDRHEFSSIPLLNGDSPRSPFISSHLLPILSI
ncbi:autophagy-related protein 13-domain-containing protein [Favolaschia claudopus]|uniref:Autophagy-related protein 13 n=1 Tax=Favolaschia claudopus TaxID=2862362 RepID=A0AAW0ANT9_9AGAR